MHLNATHSLERSSAFNMLSSCKYNKGVAQRGGQGEAEGGTGHSLPSLDKDLLTGNPRATDTKSIYQIKIDKLNFYPIRNVYLERRNEVYILYMYICRYLCGIYTIYM